MIHTILIAPYFGENMRHCLRCFADLPDCKLGVLSQEPADRLPQELRGRLAAYQQIGDPAVAAHIVDGARAILAQWGRIDRLEGYLEMLQVPIAEARDVLGIDGMRTEVAKNFRDKNRMKDVLRTAGVPVARQTLVLKVLENPWMQYALILPREVAPPHVAAFADINARALAALGMQNGLSHMEWFLRADGSAVVSEVGARPPGANIMPMLAAAHGADPWAAWAQLMVHRTWALPERRFGAGSVFLRAMGGAEVVRAVEGVDVIRQRLGPAFFDMKAPQVGQPRSSHYEGDAWVVVRHPETKGVVAAMRMVLETVRVR